MESETPKPEENPLAFLDGIQLDSIAEVGDVFNELELVHEISERWNQVLKMKRVFNED